MREESGVEMLLPIVWMQHIRLAAVITENGVGPRINSRLGENRTLILVPTKWIRQMVRALTIFSISNWNALQVERRGIDTRIKIHYAQLQTAIRHQGGVRQLRSVTMRLQEIRLAVAITNPAAIQKHNCFTTNAQTRPR